MRFLLLLGSMALSAAPAFATGLDGVWNGSYNYAGGSTARSVEFDLQLCVRMGKISGSISEPNTFGDKSSDTLKATLSGSVKDGVMKFRKTYDGTAGVRHCVDYEGKIEGDRVSGTWKIEPNGEGPFEMQLKAGTAADAHCPPETVEIRLQ